MIRSTFIHASGIGPTTEWELWERGATNWDRYLDQYDSGELHGSKFKSLAKTLSISKSELARRNVTFFSRRLAPGDHWRLFETFEDRVAYVDIETTGLSAYADITVVALHDGDKTRTFVRGRDLEKFPAAISKYSLLVTFNGSCFDVPFLRRTFKGIRIPPAHIDLRFLCQQVGCSGGLKKVEKSFGIKRPTHVRDVDGFEAIRLWRRWERGEKAALDTLLDYAATDVKNLAPLAKKACRRVAGDLGMPLSKEQKIS